MQFLHRAYGKAYNRDMNLECRAINQGGVNMRTTLMAQEASASPEKIALQLEKNNKTWRAICDYLIQHPFKFAATVARGSSDHGANFAKYLLEIHCGIITASIPPSVYTLYNRKPRVHDSLFLAISQSGQSPDLISTIKAVRTIATTIALVNVVESPLAGAAEFIIPLYAGEEKAVAATKSYIATLSALAQFVAIYTKDKVLLEALQRLPEALYKAIQLDFSPAIACLQNKENAYVIGRGYGYAVAQEAALKLKETAVLHAEPFSSAEVLHGPFSLIKPGFPVIVFAQNDTTAAGTIALAQRIANMGADVVLAMPGTKKIDALNPLPMVESLHPMLDPILIIQSFYIMAAELAVIRGFDPDQPRNLDKVTKTM